MVQNLKKELNSDYQNNLDSNVKGNCKDNVSGSENKKPMRFLTST